jgi:hypothetical protein
MSRTFLRLLWILLVGLCAQSATANDGWPDQIGGKDGFFNLGRAMQHMPGYPAKGSDIEKARFVAAKMGAVAQKYNLKPGTWHNATLAISRYCGKKDPEGAGPLKTEKVGNCGEWSFAFYNILQGAGLKSGSQVIFGVKAIPFTSTPVPYGEKFFWGADTAVIVEEADAQGRRSRRVFDIFNAARNGRDGIPTDASLKDWSDKPLTESDRWADESEASWSSRLGDATVKSGDTQELIPALPKKYIARNAPRPTNTATLDAAIAQCIKLNGTLSGYGPKPGHPGQIDVQCSCMPGFVVGAGNICVSQHDLAVAECNKTNSVLKSLDAKTGKIVCQARQAKCGAGMVPGPGGACVSQRQVAIAECNKRGMNLKSLDPPTGRIECQSRQAVCPAGTFLSSGRCLTKRELAVAACARKNSTLARFDEKTGRIECAPAARSSACCNARGDCTC